MTRIRKMVWEKDYDERMSMLDTFQDGLLLCMSDKSWVLDMFGKLDLYYITCDLSWSRFDSVVIGSKC